MPSKTLRSIVQYLFVLFAAATGLLGSQLLVAAETPVIIAPPTLDNPKAPGALQTAVVAGGCFWGVQGVFEHVRGVHKVLAGYSGGKKSSAHYDTVSSGATGHAESVQIIFDPGQVSYGELLHIFFSVVHDPTLLNKQGPDSGTQYRSAIFYTDAVQQRIAQAYIAQLEQSRAFPRTIVTRVDALSGFYPAEDHHQDFLIKNPHYPYIVVNDLPKIDNLKRTIPAYYRSEAATVDGTEPL